MTLPPFFSEGATPILWFFVPCAVLCVLAWLVFRHLDHHGYLSDEHDALADLRRINHPAGRGR